jgi:DNA-binding NtrC family response regulator
MVLHTEDRGVVDLIGMLRVFGYNVEWSTTLSDGLAGLRTTAVPAVICESNLPDGNWKDLVQHLGSFEPHPLVIVSDQDADDRLWADVLMAGAYDVLAEPFEADEVMRSLSLAIQYWQETEIFRQSSERLHSHMRRSA